MVEWQTLLRVGVHMAKKVQEDHWKLRIIRNAKGVEQILYDSCILTPATPEALREVFFRYRDAEHLGPEYDDNTKTWAIECTYMEEADGATLAYVDSKGWLHICEENPFADIFSDAMEEPREESDDRNAVSGLMPEAGTVYCSITEYAKLVNRDKSRIRVLCSQGRIEGAVKFGTMWMIPQDAPYPDDSRFVEHPKRKRKSANLP